MSVSKFELNAIFYSKRNMDLAYSLKRACREVGISLIYAFDVPDLVAFLNEVNIGIIFVDCNTLKINESILSFIKSYSSAKRSLIICIANDVAHVQENSLVDCVINGTNLLEELKQHSNFIIRELANQTYIEYNEKEVNEFLTLYLISIGFAPKHIGFTYIKQSIETALKRGGIGSLSKDIYPTVASKNHTYLPNVERNIRNAIEWACKTQDIKKDNVSMLITNSKISNRAFLCYLFDKVQNNSYKTKVG